MDEKIGELMRKEDRTRSELIREAIGRYIKEKEWEEIYSYGERKYIEKGIKKDQVEDTIYVRRK